MSHAQVIRFEMKPERARVRGFCRAFVSVQLFAKLQLVKAEMRDIVGEHVTARQELEETQAELTRELKYK